MQTLPIALVEEGMVLARDVVRQDNPTGPPVCGRGMTLTDNLLERLRTMGIKSLVVEGHPVDVDGEQSLTEMLAALEERFRKVEHDPLMIQLRECYRKIITRSMEGFSGGREAEADH